MWCNDGPHKLVWVPARKLKGEYREWYLMRFRCVQSPNVQVRKARRRAQRILNEWAGTF